MKHYVAVSFTVQVPWTAAVALAESPPRRPRGRRRWIRPSARWRPVATTSSSTEWGPHRFSQCTVSAVRPGQTHSTEDSRGASSINTTSHLEDRLCRVACQSLTIERLPTVAGTVGSVTLKVVLPLSDRPRSCRCAPRRSRPRSTGPIRSFPPPATATCRRGRTARKDGAADRLRYPGPSSVDGELDDTPLVAGGDPRRHRGARRCVHPGVRQQIRNRLMQPRTVAADPHRRRRAPWSASGASVPTPRRR